MILPANGSYLLEVARGSEQVAFDWDYALAWHMVDVVIDTDGDGIPDREDADDDNDGLPDDWELSNNLDPLDYSDASADMDADDLTSLQEYSAGSNPENPDTDNDGLSDGAEVTTHGTDPANADSDGDGLTDAIEVNSYATDPTDNDSDDDGLSDGAEVNVYGTDPANADSDNDGLTDSAELSTYGTDPLNADTDHDVVPDGTDNCPLLSNKDQDDTDGNNVGDACVNGYGRGIGKEVVKIEDCGKEIQYAMHSIQLTPNGKWWIESLSGSYSGKYEIVVPDEKLALSLHKKSKSRLYDYIGKAGKSLCKIRGKVMSLRIARFIVKLDDNSDALKAILKIKYKTTDENTKTKGVYRMVIDASYTSF
jgi:hypothetical protein